MAPVTPAGSKGPWQELPFHDTKVLGRSIWTWAAALYYLFVIWFMSAVFSQSMPMATKIEALIISVGGGLTWVAAAWLLEGERRPTS